jgi:hypothetical protein
MAYLIRSESRVSAFPVDSCFFQLLRDVIKNQLKQESGPFFLKSCDYLKSLLKSIISNPNNESIRMINLQDPQIEMSISRYPSSLLFLELLGFIRLLESEPILIFNNENLSNLKQYF